MSEKRLYVSLVLARHPIKGQHYRIRADLAESIHEAAEIGMVKALDTGLSFEDGWVNHNTRVWPLKPEIADELAQLVSEGLFLCDEGDQEFYDFGPLDITPRDAFADVWPEEIS